MIAKLNLRKKLKRMSTKTILTMGKEAEEELGRK